MFDLVLLFVFLLTVLVGVLRGSIKEIFSAAVVIISVMVTYHNGDIFLELFDVTPGPIVTPLSWISLFITSFVVLGLVNSWVMYLISPVRLGPTDRVLGLFCGVLRGFVYCYLLFAVLNVFYYSINGDEVKDKKERSGYYLPVWVKNARTYAILSYLDSSVNSVVPEEVFASLRSYSATLKKDYPTIQVSDEALSFEGALEALLGDQEELSDEAKLKALNK